MIKKTLLFFVEEPSAEEMLDELMRRIFQKYKLSKKKLDYKIFASNGKDALKIRLKGMCLDNLRKKYIKYPTDPIAIVMYDNDNNKDCKKEKKKWTERINSKFAEVVTLKNKKPPFSLYNKIPVIIRVACQELESFFLGDVKAVNQALDTKLNQLKGNYKDPDKASKPSAILEQDIKYIKGKHPREIAEYLEIGKGGIKNKSSSYKLLLTTIHILINHSGKFSR